MQQIHAHQAALAQVAFETAIDRGQILGAMLLTTQQRPRIFGMLETGSSTPEAVFLQAPDQTTVVVEFRPDLTYVTIDTRSGFSQRAVLPGAA